MRVERGILSTFRASLKIPRSPRLANKVPVIYANYAPGAVEEGRFERIHRTPPPFLLALTAPRVSGNPQC